MVCVYCSSPTKTTNSRKQSQGFKVWRRHYCVSCGNTFTTFEEADLSTTHRVQKRRGTIEPFSSAKLFLSVFRAIDHRTDAANNAQQLSHTITINLLQEKQALLQVSKIAELVVRVLKRFDAAAAVRYQSFQNPLQNKRDVRRAIR